MTEEEEKLLIGELAKKAGVSTRTIRYYIEEGLLPSPDTRGRYTLYNEDYLKRISLIKLLKQNFLPLKEIRLILERLDPDEIDNALKRYKLKNVTEAPRKMLNKIEDSDSAVDYIRRVIDSQRIDVHIADTGFAYSEPLRAPAPQSETTSPQVKQILWRRYEVAQGIELHIIDGKMDDPTLQQLLQTIRNQLKE